MNSEQLIIFLVLFGAVQGFTLCFYLWPRRQENPLAYGYFVLLLASLAYFNLSYAFLSTEIYIGRFQLALMPLAYKYLIPVGFAGYVYQRIQQKTTIAFGKRYWWLFLPALVYTMLRSSWFYDFYFRGNEDAFFVVYRTGFFTYNEFVYLFFSLGLGLFALSRLGRIREQVEATSSNLKRYLWLLRFTHAYLLFVVINLLHSTFGILFALQDSGPYYFLVLLVNSAYIYWIGFEGYSKPKGLLTPAILVDSAIKTTPHQHDRLTKLLEVDRIYERPGLKAKALADLLEMPQKDLGLLLKEKYGVSFNGLIKKYRVERVKVLLQKPEADQFTLLAIAEAAGFKSKSTFNAAFKQQTGMTPKQYRDQLKGA